jgi:hypothetical protein
MSQPLDADGGGGGNNNSSAPTSLIATNIQLLSATDTARFNSLQRSLMIQFVNLGIVVALPAFGEHQANVFIEAYGLNFGRIWGLMTPPARVTRGSAYKQAVSELLRQFFSFAQLIGTAILSRSTFYHYPRSYLRAMIFNVVFSWLSPSEQTLLPFV